MILAFPLGFRFNASDFLGRSRNGRIIFAGDSIGRNQWQWESLLCMLSKGVSNQSSIYEVYGVPISKHKTYFPSFFKSSTLALSIIVFLSSLVLLVLLLSRLDKFAELSRLMNSIGGLGNGPELMSTSSALVTGGITLKLSTRKPLNYCSHLHSHIYDDSKTSAIQIKKMAFPYLKGLYFEEKGVVNMT